MKFLISICLASLSLFTHAESYELTYKEPAKSWQTGALPIGNGSLGAMAFSGVSTERIQFNEETLWNGSETNVGFQQSFGDILLYFSDQPAYSMTTYYDSQDEREHESIHNASDGNLNSRWVIAPLSKRQAKNAKERATYEVFYPLGKGKALKEYSIAARKNNGAPRNWILEASNDSKNWQFLDKKENVAEWEGQAKLRKFTLDNSTAFRYYRLRFHKSFDRSGHFEVNEIRFGKETDKKMAYSNYRRQLSLRDASLRTVYSSQGTKFNRTYLSSHPDKVMAFHFSADKKGAYNTFIRFRDARWNQTSVEGNKLSFKGQLKSLKTNENGDPVGHPVNGPFDEKFTLNYEAQMLVKHHGGELISRADGVRLKNVDSFTIYVVAGTDFLRDRAQGWRGALPHERLTNDLKRASQKSFKQIFLDHKKDYQELFDRVNLQLGDTDKSLAMKPTNERIRAYSKGSVDPDLEEMLFHFGRYLLISSSRVDSLVPSNLQGIWNDSLTPPWSCDLHVDVNIQMNYWAADQVNLSSCFKPFHHWIDSIREVRKEETRKKLGVKKGWAFRTGTNYYGASTWHWMKGAAAWCSNNMWDHYMFTQDKEYLKSLYPIMKELCEFWIEELKELPDGTLVAPNSWSPERGPRMDGTSHEQQLIWDLFKSTSRAIKVLQVDQAFAEKLDDMRKRLLGPQVGKWGQLQEWAKDIDNPNDKHRHLSHLMALHPGSQISPLTTPEWAKASAVSLNARGDEGTGWSRAEKICMWARLHDGERSHKLIRGFFNLVENSYLAMHGGGLFSNMLCAHPPFQIDGNFGYVAGICEMLVQSHMDFIHILPALPKAWPNGEVKGLKARGNILLNVKWENGQLVRVQAKALSAGNFKFFYNGKKKAVKLAKGQTISFKL